MKLPLIETLGLAAEIPDSTILVRSAFAMNADQVAEAPPVTEHAFIGLIEKTRDYLCTRVLMNEVHNDNELRAGFCCLPSYPITR